MRQYVLMANDRGQLEVGDGEGTPVWDPVISTDAVEIEMKRVSEVTMLPK